MYAAVALVNYQRKAYAVHRQNVWKPIMQMMYSVVKSYAGKDFLSKEKWWINTWFSKKNRNDKQLQKGFASVFQNIFRRWVVWGQATPTIWIVWNTIPKIGAYRAYILFFTIKNDIKNEDWGLRIETHSKQRSAVCSSCFLTPHSSLFTFNFCYTPQAVYVAHSLSLCSTSVPQT